MKKLLLLIILLISVNILLSQCLTYKYANAPFVNPSTGPDLTGITCVDVSGANGNGNYEAGSGLLFLNNSLPNCGTEVETGWYSHDGGTNWHYFDQSGPFFSTYLLGQPNGNPLPPDNGSSCGGSCSNMTGTAFYITGDNGGSPDCGDVSINQAGNGKYFSASGDPIATINRTSIFRPDCSISPSGWYSLDWNLGAATGDFYFWDGIGSWSNTGSCGGALPIDLVSFNGEAVGSKVTIKWIVNSQVNNDYFEIQKSLNLDKWDLVDSVTGAGTTNRQMSYSTVDYNSNIGYTYYRLKQVDHNGESETFYPIAIQVKGERKHIIKTINLQGNEIDSTSKGLMIHIWDNGTVTKVMK